jgi:phospholipid-translocating ATPase
VLLKTTEHTGTCFIRTDQLDGETDWKLRIAVPSTQQIPSYADIFDLKGSVFAEKPEKDIYVFLGTLTFDRENEQITEPLNIENTLWANTVVASGSALGFVVYTGRDTRAVMNTSFPGTKVGLLDLEINRLSKVPLLLYKFKILAVVLFALAITMVGLQGFRALWYVNCFRFLILFSSIIPIRYYYYL